MFNGLQLLALVIASAALIIYSTHRKGFRDMGQPLNDIMEFGHVIEIHKDGKITEPTGIYCDAELNVMTNGEDDFYLPKGWELITNGYTGQYGYSGPVMHSSEFIGGRLERDILERPGYYVALIVNGYCDYSGETQCTEDIGCDCEPAGWTVAFKPSTETDKD